MRVPDYGHGDWEVKYARNRKLPSVEKIGLDGEVIYIALSRQADSIKVTGQDHTTLSLARNSSEASYTMTGDNDPYARITAYFPRRRGDLHQSVRTVRRFRNGTNSRIRLPSHTVNIPLTILFNFTLLVLCAGVILMFYKTVIKW